MSAAEMDCLLPTLAAGSAVSEKHGTGRKMEKAPPKQVAALPGTSETECLIRVAHFLQPPQDRRESLMKLLLCSLD